MIKIRILPKLSEDCERDARELSHALYVDDFESIDTWLAVCNMLNVPTDADQIYFNATNITYGK
tara:strand:- start:41 stop:232 length:192 start_codon:yes stop_codon:yes gene_type:complete